MTAAYKSGNTYFQAENVDAATTVQTFNLLSGKYSLVVLAASWGGGNVELQLLGPDASTYVKVGTQVTANGVQTVDLPAGKYKLVITTTNAVYASLARINQV